MEEIKVLDHGFVRLVDVMGSDEDIVRAARVSYGKHDGKQKNVRGLIRYLMRHRHTSPFEMVEFKFHVKAPIFVARQWFRHRTASVNEISGRYTKLPDEVYMPDEIRVQSKGEKQGSDGAHPNNHLYLRWLELNYLNARDSYAKMVEDGVAKEQARMVLPLSQYTEFYWKQDLHNLLHFLKLRMDRHAQWEIQQYANAIAEFVKKQVPIAYKAWEDYVLNAVTLPSIAAEAMHLMSDEAKFDLAKSLAYQLQLAEPMSAGELEDILNSLGLWQHNLEEVRDDLPDWVCKILDGR